MTDLDDLLDDPANPSPIELEWQTFRKHCVSKGASRAQLMAMKIAFFGGASAFHAILLSRMSDGADATAEDERVVVALEDEIRDFANRVARVDDSVWAKV